MFNAYVNWLKSHQHTTFYEKQQLIFFLPVMHWMPRRWMCLCSFACWLLCQLWVKCRSLDALGCALFSCALGAAFLTVCSGSTSGAWKLLLRCSWSTRVDTSMALLRAERVHLSEGQRYTFQWQNLTHPAQLKENSTTLNVLVCDLFLSGDLAEVAGESFSYSSWILLCFHHICLWVFLVAGERNYGCGLPLALRLEQAFHDGSWVGSSEST